MNSIDRYGYSKSIQLYTRLFASSTNFSSFDKSQVEVTGGSDPTSSCGRMDLFTDQRFNIDRIILENVTKCGYIDTTPIQSVSIPILMKTNDDIMACAQTGSGKTVF